LCLAAAARDGYDTFIIAYWQTKVNSTYHIQWQIKKAPGRDAREPEIWRKALLFWDYLLASSIATATATVIPTMGLLPVVIIINYHHW
jgi:hypothetical protein